MTAPLQVAAAYLASAALSEIGDAAARHGRALLQRGFTVEEVVHDCGDLCQAITDLTVELDADIDIDEFRTLKCCLDNAIANAVTEFSYQRDFIAAGTRAPSNGTNVRDSLRMSCAISSIPPRLRSRRSRPAT